MNVQPTAEDGMSLWRELRLSPTTGAVCGGGDELIVFIFDGRRRPAIIKWHGWPVRYEIGTEAPIPFGVA